MSSPQGMGAHPSTAGRIQERESLSSSQEHQPTSVHRNDEATALKEAVSEECTEVRNAGPPGPGGRRNSKSNQANEMVNQSQQATGAAMGNANLVANSLNITYSVGHKSNTADSLEWGSSSTRTSSRRRTTVKNFTGEEQINACEWKKHMGLICTRECTCRNSIPQREEERVSKVRGMDVAADSWGVVANADIQDGEILTVFRGTTYFLCSTPEGKEFSKIQAKMVVEGMPLQYTFQGHLAEASTEQVWAIPEPDKESVRTRADVSPRLRRALNPEGDQGVGHLVNRTCCVEHCNAELLLTRAISGDPRINFGNDESAITLAIRAKKFIKRHEAILVHYNPEEGIASWKHVFKCACCRCKGQCGSSAQISHETRQAFTMSVQQAQHEGVSDARGMTKGDFVRTHLNDFWGNIVEVTNDGVKVKGFCITAKRLITKRIQAEHLQRDDRTVKWHGASRILRRCAIAKIWAQSGQPAGAKGGWLEDETVDSAVRWSLYGNTNVAGLTPCSTRNGYIPCVALHELRELLASTPPLRAGAPRTSLRAALEGLTGMQGCHWKEIEGPAPEDGLELVIPALQQALLERSDLSMTEWHQMNVWGLQSRHYVRVGNRIMKPQRQRNHKLAKWLKNAGWRIDMTSMENMFATFHAHNHYFTIHWNPQDKVFELCDALANVTTADHHEAIVLLWAMLLASARTDDNLWTVEPRLSLSEHQILGGFRSFLLGSPGGERCEALTEEDKINLQRMGIEVQGMAECTAGVWTWRRDTAEQW
jgi:hypothetical protein